MDSFAVASSTSAPLTNRNLRLLVLGQFISALGDNFYLIAMPWLGLQLTGSAFVAGTLLAVASIPRSLFMLLGGAVTDRYSAKKLLVIANGLQGLLMLLLGILVLTPLLRLWFLYVLVFMTGFAEAFGLPAFNALLPRIVEQGELEIGNIYLQGANMVSGIIGPALAGLLISIFAPNPDLSLALKGLGLVFLIDAVTFFAGISFFLRIRIGTAVKVAERSAGSPLTSIRTLIDYLRTDLQLRNLLLLMVVLGLFLTGAIRVGFPMLAETNFISGAKVFGFMTSAFGVGIFIGMISVKLLPRPAPRISGLVLLSLFALMPAGVVSLAFAPSFQATLGIILVMGVAFGYVNIYLLSWLQRRTPGHLLGRVIALVLFSTIGLAPLSQAWMGYLLDRHLSATLVVAGSLMLVFLVFTAANRKMWALEG
jgi:MFS family permease